MYHLLLWSIGMIAKIVLLCFQGLDNIYYELAEKFQQIKVYFDKYRSNDLPTKISSSPTYWRGMIYVQNQDKVLQMKIFKVE